MAIPLKLATEQNEKAFGRDVKFLVKFDWQNDNWQAGIKDYDRWNLCYELRSGELLNIGDWDSALTLNVNYSGDYGLANPYMVVPSESNSGNGYISFSGEFPIKYELPGEGESFMAIAMDNEAEGDCNFLMKCNNKNINVLDDINLNEPYGYYHGFKNGYLKLQINSGSSPFIIGDTFNIYPAITTKELNQSATIVNGNDGYTNLVIEGGPDFLYWNKVTWISEGDVRVFIRTCLDIASPRWSDWYSYSNGDMLASEQARRYLQFKVVLNSSATVRAKIAQIVFSYDVKAHTNNEASIYYEKNFNDIVSIRINRSKDSITAGYSAADCDLVMNNVHRQYNVENISSIYFGKIQPRLRFIVEIGFDEQTIQKIEAFATSFKLDTSNRTISIHGQDYVKQFLAKKIDDKDIASRVFVNKPIDFLVKMVAIDVGFPLNKLKLEDTTIVDDVPYAYFRGQEAWKAIQDLLLGYEGEIYIDESGSLIIRDRFKQKNIYRSPRESSKNVVQSIAYNGSNDDIFMVVKSEEYDNSFLYMYNSEYTNIDTGIYSILYCAEDQVDSFSSMIGVKENKLVRITGDSEIPSIEDLVELLTYKFTNSMTYQNTLYNGYRNLYGILNNGTAYKFYKYKLLDDNNNILYESSNNIYQFLSFDGGLNATLSSNAKNIKTSLLTAINSVTSAEQVLSYGSDWVFIDSTYSSVHLIAGYNAINSYLLSYVPTNPITLLETELGAGFDIDIDYPEKLILPMENNAAFFAKCVINIADGYGRDGQVLLVNFNSVGNLYVMSSAGGIQYEYTDDTITKYFGGACDDDYGKIYLFVLTSDNKKKILSFDLTNFNAVVDTGDEVLLDGVDDTLLNVYDVCYNDTDKYVYIACGYGSEIDKPAYLLRYKQSHVDVDWENTVGKPLEDVVVRNRNAIDSVIDKQYNIFFQKRGGIGATTSQIWSWFPYTRNSDDKIKSGIWETLEYCESVPAHTSPDGLCTTFRLPATSELDFNDIEFIYKSDANEGWVNIGDNYYKDIVNNYIILTEAININVVQIRAGSGKIIKRYYGEYFKINSDSTLLWQNMPFVSYPYKPSRIRFYGDNLVAGTIEVSGYAIDGSFQHEYLNYIPTSGYVETEHTYQKEYYGLVGITAESVKGIGYSTLTCESTYEDLIPGIDIYAYVNPNDIEEQFGGNGLVTSFTQEAAINVQIKDGIEIVNKMPSGKAVTAISMSDEGRVFGGTSYTGQFFLYEKNNIIEGFYDYDLSYDKNIAKLDYEWDDSDIKNSVTVKASKKEVAPYRESELDTGVLISSVPDSSHMKDWFKLERLYKTEAPSLLSPGNYYEADINFSEPVLTHDDNMLRFNAHMTDYAGPIESGSGPYGNGYYVDLTRAEHSGNGFELAWPDRVEFKLNQSFMSLGPSGSYISPYDGEEYWIDVAEAEKRNMEIYIGSRKLYYTSGEFSINIIDNDYVLSIPTVDNHYSYNGGDLSIHYPMRWNIPRETLERNIDTSGINVEEYLWSIIYDVHYEGIPDVYNADGKLKYYYVDRPGFQIDVVWPNRATYAETTYLRLENPAIDALDAYYDPESNPSGWTVWIDKVELRGLPVFSVPVTIATQKDLESIDKYFEQTYSLDNEYIQTVDVGERLAKYILKNSSKPIIKPSVQIIGYASMQLGDVVAIKDTNTSLDGDLFEVISLSDELSIDSAYLTTLGLKKISDNKSGTGIYNQSTFDSSYVYK